MVVDQFLLEDVGDMNLAAVSVSCGTIYSRDALILKGVDLEFYPFKVSIHATLALSGCRPAGVGEVEMEFVFSDISSFSIFRLDDYPGEKFTVSSFDKIEGESRYILSTYDHVFDVAGHCSVVMGKVDDNSLSYKHKQ